jgi:hypothetical protein
MGLEELAQRHTDNFMDLKLPVKEYIKKRGVCDFASALSTTRLTILCTVRWFAHLPANRQTPGRPWGTSTLLCLPLRSSYNFLRRSW